MKNGLPVLSSLSVVDGVPRASSLDVAEKFGKEHKDVLRAIETAIMQVPEIFGRRNFALSEYEVDQGLGVRKQPFYQLTRDGFSYVCMGFTGKEAARWKVAYIEAFNAMEKALLDREAKFIDGDFFVKKGGKLPLDRAKLVNLFKEYFNSKAGSPVHLLRKSSPDNARPFYDVTGQLFIQPRGVRIFLESKHYQSSLKEICACLHEFFDCELPEECKVVHSKLKAALAFWEAREEEDIQAMNARYLKEKGHCPPAIEGADASTLTNIRRELAIVQSAIEGADMGDGELQDAMACKLLEIMNTLEAQAQ